MPSYDWEWVVRASRNVRKCSEGAALPSYAPLLVGKWGRMETGKADVQWSSSAFLCPSVSMLTVHLPSTEDFSSVPPLTSAPFRLSQHLPPHSALDSFSPSVLISLPPSALTTALPFSPCQHPPSPSHSTSTPSYDVASLSTAHNTSLPPSNLTSLPRSNLTTIHPSALTSLPLLKATPFHICPQNPYPILHIPSLPFSTLLSPLIAPQLPLLTLLSPSDNNPFPLFPQLLPPSFITTLPSLTSPPFPHSLHLPSPSHSIPLPKHTAPHFTLWPTMPSVLSQLHPSPSDVTSTSLPLPLNPPSPVCPHLPSHSSHTSLPPSDQISLPPLTTPPFTLCNIFFSPL
ncbi:unnamed protein product [Closterium sp. Naga37s-1]|nr:unnamed protein product [Closterium sp. Naga37s-1]